MCDNHAMIRFNNDYNQGAHPAILEALAATNGNAYPGYGLDGLSEAAADEIKKHLGGAEADVHFLVGGTQANFTVIARALRPHEAVLCPFSGHINVHETGAVENTGHKILTVPGKDGKIGAEDIEKVASGYESSTVPEHINTPRLVYISLPTEYGTVYTKAELEDISDACHRHGLYLFIDGARLGYGLAAADVTLQDLARLADVFYIGGTKCGALFGEAVVLVNDGLKPYFRSYMKQNGAMLAKGWLLGLQFLTLFKDGLYFSITAKAVGQAMRIKAAFAERGIPSFIDSPTNQQFVVVNESQMAKLSEKYYYEYEDNLGNGLHSIRFCTSWATKDEDVDELVKDIALL